MKDYCEVVINKEAFTDEDHKNYQYLIKLLLEVYKKYSAELCSKQEI